MNAKTQLGEAFSGFETVLADIVHARNVLEHFGDNPGSTSARIPINLTQTGDAMNQLLWEIWAATNVDELLDYPRLNTARARSSLSLPTSATPSSDQRASADQ